MTTCVRGANSSVPKTSGWLLVRDAGWRVCAAKRWRRSPVSARAYYLRLEQGRDTRPSEQVVEALARALLLDLKATEYLHRLATGAGSRRPQPAGDTVAEGLRQLIDQVSVPVILGNRYMDVLIANPCARALAPGFSPGRNLLHWVFVAPAARDFYVHWDVVTDIIVSEFREVAGTDLGDPRLRAIDR